MQDNRNACSPQSCDSRGMVCIDTTRILDACRDRDCFEDERVYLTASGEDILGVATNIRTKAARILFANVGVDEVPFNNGFYRISIRYYVEVTFEACVAIGKSACFSGIAVIQKEVVLYGGEGNITTYSSTPGSNFCDPCSSANVSTNLPIAVVETVEPVILGTKVLDKCCVCSCEALDLPDEIRCCLNEPLVESQHGIEIRVSIGLFSIIRMERPAQLLIQATDYAVPDKECTLSSSENNPCDIFRGIAFPTSRFRTTICQPQDPPPKPHGSCGCK
ncbi:MAG: hypothetical protein IKC32_07540 [Clostridia bacterium]|nr:hypothetical protein [Clostridia bacterium]